MRVLFVSNLYPDRQQPLRGIQNAELVRRLAEHVEVRLVVTRPALAPPWGRCAATGRILREDLPFQPLFVRTPFLPRFGGRITPVLHAAALRHALARSRDGFRPDVIVTAWLYPDVCAVAALNQRRLPLVAVAQGSDVNVYMRAPQRRAAILAALHRCNAVVTVSAALAARLAELGAPRERLHPILRGVDLELFRPGDRAAARRRLGLPERARVLLFVGRLERVKAPELALEALAGLQRSSPGPPTLLVVAGEGRRRGALVRQAARLGLTQSVRFLGEVPRGHVVTCMQAADCLLLPSRAEGAPAVVREALACGLPVVASRVGGVPELLDNGPCGRLVPPEDAIALARAAGEVVLGGANREATREWAERHFSWSAAVRQLLELLETARPR